MTSRYIRATWNLILVQLVLSSTHSIALQNGVREKGKVIYNTALGVIFGVKKYAEELLKVSNILVP